MVRRVEQFQQGLAGEQVFFVQDAGGLTEGEVLLHEPGGQEPCARPAEEERRKPEQGVRGMEQAQVYLHVAGIEPGGGGVPGFLPEPLPPPRTG